jgi:hypothetical protein
MPTRLGKTLWPASAVRHAPKEVEKESPSLAADFNEAVAVLPASKKASAALSRRCLQAMLKQKACTTTRDLADQIEEVVHKLPSEIALNIDAVRNIGNFAAHPLKSKSTGEITDVEENEAEWLLDVLEELFDHYYVAPARAKEKRDSLNRKLQDIGKPPMKQP